MSETLNVVRHNRRADDKCFIESNADSYLIGMFNDTIEFDFYHISSAGIEEGREYAIINGKEIKIQIQQKGEIDWPHWLFEELYSIMENDSLRPTGDYKAEYQLRHNRAIKGV